jgi:hypothetical protein
MRLPVFATFPPPPVGLSWQSIAIDRSQAVAAGINLNTVSRGGGGDAVTATRWTPPTGIGPEAAAMRDGVLCNSIGAASWRALLYSMPLRSQEPNAGQVLYSADTVILDCLIAGDGLGNDHGVFLLQTDGTVAGTTLPGAGGAGVGFRHTGLGVECWSSALGAVAVSGALPAQSLSRCTLTVRSARTGQAGTVSWAVNGVPLAARQFSAAVGNGPNQGYQAGRFTYWPVVSSSGITLFVADLSILSTQPGVL